jgi:hypothetical protein
MRTLPARARFEVYGPADDVIVESSPTVDDIIKQLLPRRHRRYDARAGVWRVHPAYLCRLVVAWMAAGHQIEGAAPGGDR